MVSGRDFKRGKSLKYLWIILTGVMQIISSYFVLPLIFYFPELNTLSLNLRIFHMSLSVFSCSSIAECT